MKGFPYLVKKACTIEEEFDRMLAEDCLWVLVDISEKREFVAFFIQ